MSQLAVGVSEMLVKGRLNPSPKSARCEPREAMREFAFVELKPPKVMNGRYLYPFINCTTAGEKPRAAGSISPAGSRHSPNCDQAPITSRASDPWKSAV